MAPKILVVDDEVPILFALCDYFAMHGCKVDGAHELGEAKALLTTRSYSVVISDLCLSRGHGTEGLDIATYVRERCPGTRMILLTAYGSPEIEAEARRRGVDVFLHKPKPLPEIAQLVFGLIRSKNETP